MRPLHPDEQQFASTTFVTKRVKMSRSAGGQKGDRPKAGHLRQLPKWPWRRPLTIRVSYRGGEEAWFEIHTRGVVVRRPGWVQLVDLMRDLTGQ